MATGAFPLLSVCSSLCCRLICCVHVPVIVLQMSQPSTDEAVQFLKAALLREVATNPAMLFPHHKNLQAAIDFSLQLTGHIGKLATEAACAFSLSVRLLLSLCSISHVSLLSSQECIGTQSGPRPVSRATIGTQSGPRPVSRATTGRSYRRKVHGEQGREEGQETACRSSR